MEMDINWFDNYEEDGQLSLFSVGEEIEDLRESEPKENIGKRQGGTSVFRQRRHSYTEMQQLR